MHITIETAKEIAAAGEELKRARAWAAQVRTATRVKVSLEFPPAASFRGPETIQVLDHNMGTDAAAVIRNRIAILADQRVAAAERKLRQLGAVVPD